LFEGRQQQQRTLPWAQTAPPEFAEANGGNAWRQQIQLVRDLDAVSATGQAQTRRGVPATTKVVAVAKTNSQRPHCRKFIITLIMPDRPPIGQVLPDRELPLAVFPEPLAIGRRKP
jgi:hypothetical protein